MASAVIQPILARATTALERGRGSDAAQLLQPALRSSSLTREDELTLRVLLAEAWLLQDDPTQAAASLGRPPEAVRETTVSPATLSHLWRLHGRVVSTRGDQSRAVGFHQKALRLAEQAHDLRATGLAHFELARCYKNVGDRATMAEHFNEAATALHAVGDKRHLALVHSLSGSDLAQEGRYDEALMALRQAERLAQAVGADDVVAIACGNQANVAMIRHRYDHALTLAERAVTLHQQYPPGHGLAVSLGTLGQIAIRQGQLTRAAEALNAALDVRTPLLYHETTGAIFDSLAQIHLIRGDYDACADALAQARDAFGDYDAHTPRWYDWSLRLIDARVTLRRGDAAGALARADAIIASPGLPPADQLHAELVAAEALVEAARFAEAERRLERTTGLVDPRTMPGAWGEYLRVRGVVAAASGRATEGYHDLSQSGTVFDLLGERYQSALSQLALGVVAARAGARSLAERALGHAESAFRDLGAARDVRDVTAARALLDRPGAGAFVGAPPDADDAVVRRLVDAAALPELLARETAAALHEVADATSAMVVLAQAGAPVRVSASVGVADDDAMPLAVAAAAGRSRDGLAFLREGLGREGAYERIAVIVLPREPSPLVARRVRMVAAVARQGFELCEARDRPARAPNAVALERPLEPLIAGFLCAGAAMARVVDQIKRLQATSLTVLITGESGTGKELVARAIHAGSRRSTSTFLPYNCTTTTRELADSQLFGHKRGSFTGALTDQPGLVRTSAGGTLFLDEIGDLPIDVQPKLLRFLEQGEIMPVGETRPQQVDVRVLAATNADLEQRVGEGRFREDLYYRLSVIRLHVPPLRQRRDEIPLLSSFFLREAADELAKPDVELSPEVLDLFAQYMWPGNIRQLRNEIRRAVAMSPPATAIAPDMLSPELARLDKETPAPAHSRDSRRLTSTTLSVAVDELERDLIRHALEQAAGNISESARPDPPRALSQTAAPRPGRTRERGYKVVSQSLDCIPGIEANRLAARRLTGHFPFDSVTYLSFAGGAPGRRDP
jgi:transcriptional regulator with AAA-type ATPase domain/tetratricopeptide (TPR) repeat protein